VIDTSNNELYVQYTTPGVYTVSLLTLNKCGQALGSRNTIVSDYPDPSFTFDTPVCTGENSVMMYSGTTPAPLSFNWNFDGGTGVPGGNIGGPQYVEWDDPGPKDVILQVTQYGCSSYDTNTVNVVAGPNAAFSFSGQCSGVPITFTDSLQGNPNYWLWNFGDGTGTMTGSPVTHTYANAGTYWIMLVDTNANGCTDTLFREFTVFASPIPSFYSKSPVCAGENSTVTYTGNASTAAVYNWDFGLGTIVSGSGQGPYEILWPGIGNYPISLVVTENGCVSDTTVQNVELSGCEITIPNIITPNGDGKNDVFNIKGLESFPDSHLTIYNRWGKIIYENKNYLNDWGGEDHADGVYYFVLVLKNGNQASGTVTLMR
jgi:gliding motility-associated-like protein